MMDIEFSAIQIEYVFNEENAIYSMILWVYRNQV